ncbi:hypothetical protein [Pseudomonas frederiksbergensis]|uniref:hypothetical protein n=1 Tax=Pseudomonas frederiksbergensis TaxID=104087 RepID=UPI000F4617E1|nr:hypothetical protein [Pseudomonas frederiksbergensis]RON54156.1 hypothetical protein BK667_11710 [Pseudomonas frederiksbergensis]
MNTQDTKPPLGSWLADLRIAVMSPSDRVYPNGRQQIEVRVLVESRMAIPLKDEEKKSIKLVVRDRLGQLLELPEGTELTQPWFFSDTPNTYLQYPGTLKSVPDDTPTNIFTQSFYVSAGQIEPRQRQETLYVSITRHTDDGHQHRYYTDGSETSFNKSVDVRTAEIPTYQVPGNYTFERTLTEGNENSDIFTLQYSLAGAGVQQPVVGFVSANMLPPGMIQWADKHQSVTQASNVGYAAPGGTTFIYNTNIQLGSTFTPVRQVKNPKANHVTLVLQASNNIPYHSQSAINHNGPCVIKAVDVYGNDHHLQVRFKDTTPQGRFELVLV